MVLGRVRNNDAPAKEHDGDAGSLMMFRVKGTTSLNISVPRLWHNDSTAPLAFIRTDSTGWQTNCISSLAKWMSLRQVLKTELELYVQKLIIMASQLRANSLRDHR